MSCKSIIAVAALLLVAATALGQQRVALCGSGSDRVVVVDMATGVVERSYTLPSGAECNSVDAVGGDLVFSYRAGVRRIDSLGRVVWDYLVGRAEEAQTARVVNGRVIVAICGTPARIVELDATTGDLLSQTSVDTGIDDAHGQFRQVAKSKMGNYLIPLMGSAKVIEVDLTGTVVEQWSVPESPFSVKEINDGRTLMVSTKSALVEIDRQSKAQKVVVENQIEDQILYFITEAHRFDDRSTLISNWQGYAPKECVDAQLVLVDRAGKLLKKYRFKDAINHVSGFCLL